MLAKRFKDDGKSTVRLNKLQWQMKRQIEQKIANGVYSFEEVPCCICGGKNFEILSKKDHFGLCMPVVICRDCGLAQTNPRMTRESYDQFYEIEYRRLYEGEDIPTHEFFKLQWEHGGEIYDYLIGNLAQSELKNLFVVEVGCASGGILQRFKERGNEVYGVDLDSRYLEFGRVNYGLDMEIGAIDKAVKLSRSADIVIYSHVLEHILDPITELTKLREIMKENSFLYIELPGIKYLGVSRGYQADFLRYLQNAHVYHFTQTTLRNLLRKAGYDFVCGDEYIHSIFRKSPLPDSAAFHWDSDYQSVRSFLRRMEFMRLLPTTHRLPSSFVRMTAKALKVAGVYDFALKLYRRVMS